MIEISELNFQQADFWPMLSELLAWEGVSDAAITDTVRNILADVKQRGDQAVVEYSQRFDRVKATAMAELEIPLERAAAALELYLLHNVRRWKKLQNVYVSTMNTRNRNPGIT